MPRLNQVTGLVLVAAFALLSGCGNPKYTVEVPKDVPERVTLRFKDNTTKEANGRAMYRAAHRKGWNEYLRRFRGGEIDLADEDIMPLAVAEFELTARAREEGFAACRAALQSQQ